MLHPSADSMPPISGAKRNNNGCVLRVAAGTHAALLPADIEAPAERRLVKDHADLLPATVLIAPHHGSKSSSTTEFIQTVNPDYVIFAAAFGNSYHFPNPIIASRYLELGTQLEQTGLSGAISVEITAELGIGKPKRWRKLGSHFWNAPELPGDLLAESEVN